MKIHFQRDSKGMFRFVLSILFILAIPIIFSSVLSCRISVEREPIFQQPISRIEGSWLVINPNPGKLEFHWTGNAWTGRIWFDALQRWEDLTEVSFDSQTGKVQFFRTIDSERFYGTVSGSRITGTFTYGALTYSWEAKRP